MGTAVKKVQAMKYCSFNAAGTRGDTNSTSCDTLGTWACGTWRAEENELNLLPLQGWEMPAWHVTQHWALLKPAGSLQKYKCVCLVIHLSTCQCWGQTGKLHVLKTKFFSFCCFSELSKADVVSATPKLSSWDNYLWKEPQQWSQSC